MSEFDCNGNEMDNFCLRAAQRLETTKAADTIRKQNNGILKSKRFLELTEDTWRAYGKPMFLGWEDIGVDDKNRLMEATKGHELTAQAFEREASDLYQIATSRWMLT